MGCQHFQQDEGWTNFIQLSNYICSIIFILEFIAKYIAFLNDYWLFKWNHFDFYLVLTIVLDFILHMTSNSLSNINLSFFRIFRIARLVRLVNFSRNLKAIISTLIVSLPSLLNVGSLMLLLMFVYAILGMNLYGREHGIIDKEIAPIDFTTFGGAMGILFQSSSGEGWTLFMHSLIDAEYYSSILYFISFIILCTYLLLNLIVGVMVENFYVRSKEEEAKFESLNFIIRSFNQAWGYVAGRDQFTIKSYQLVELFSLLDAPLGFRVIMQKEQIPTNEEEEEEGDASFFEDGELDNSSNDRNLNKNDPLSKRDIQKMSSSNSINTSRRRKSAFKSSADEKIKKNKRKMLKSPKNDHHSSSPPPPSSSSSYSQTIDSSEEEDDSSIVQNSSDDQEEKEEMKSDVGSEMNDDGDNDKDDDERSSPFTSPFKKKGNNFENDNSSSTRSIKFHGREQKLKSEYLSDQVFILIFVFKSELLLNYFVCLILDFY